MIQLSIVPILFCWLQIRSRPTVNGIRFPVANGYMYLCRGGSYSAMFSGSELLPEGAALIYRGTIAQL